MSSTTMTEELASAAVRLYNTYGDPGGVLTPEQRAAVEKASEVRAAARKACMGNAAVREACSSKPGGFDQYAFDILMGAGPGRASEPAGASHEG